MYRYSLLQFGEMIENTSRMGAYAEALRQAVNDQSVVVDIGAGTGIFSLLAASFGARRVFAIEPDDVVWLVKAIAQVNGLQDRIEIFDTLSHKVVLPEPATVIISDLRTVLPFFHSIIPTIVDARKRLLAAGGTLIPQMDRMYAALAYAPKDYARRHDQPWISNPYKLDMSPVRDLLVNSWYRTELRPEHLVSETRELGTIDYRTISDPNFGCKASWEVAETTLTHGVCVWFDTVLIDSIGFSNQPGRDKLIYGQAFFPFPKLLHLEPDEILTLRLRASYISEEYVWTWSTAVKDKIGHIKYECRQSTFLSKPLSKSKLVGHDMASKPTLGLTGEMNRFVLSIVNGRMSLDSLAARLMEQYPVHFERRQDAAEYIAQLLEACNT